MPDLMFRESTHTYTLEGKVLPCVSDLCRFLHREIYRDVQPWRMEAAAQRGHAVHAATQALDLDGYADVEREYLPYLEAYRRFHREHAVAWQLIEKPMYHPEHLYAGTIDRYGLLDGNEALVDIKTTYTVYKPLCAAQLNLYRWMLAARGYLVRKMYILHLKRDGTYKLIPIAFDDAIPTALLTLHNALRKRRRKGVNHV